MLARLKKTQAYASQGFEPVSCFAGQVKVQGKPLSRQPFSLLTPDADMKCCGKSLRNGQTDRHGHFLIEPLAEGRYFAKFKSGDSDEVAGLAVVHSYERCGSTHIEINFSKAGKAIVQDIIDINDWGEDCKEYEPQCYRK
jgi:hypothetical protein